MLRQLAPHLQIERADCLSTGLEWLAHGQFDAVLVDLWLPDSRGLETFERIHAADASVPIVLLSDQNDEELGALAVRAGAQDYLVKGTVDGASLGRSLCYAIERKHAREALDISEAQTRALFDAMPDTMFRMHRDGRCVDFKPSGSSSVSSPAEHLLREGMETSVARELDELNELYRRNLEAALDSGETQVFEYQQRSNGETRHCETRLVATGATEAVALVRDVTDSRRLAEQLRLSQRLEAVGRLAGGIAHDFNNILTVISGNAELALAMLSEDEPKCQEIEEIREAARRAATLTRQLLAFSRKQVLKPVPLELNTLVRGTEKMLRRLIGEDLELVTSLQAGLGTIRADPAQIEQILMNLAINARDAMPKGGKLVFETKDIDVHDTYIGQGVEVTSGPYVMLAVSDTGIGMDPSTKLRAFEPFFTTKERGKGTGLGLSMVYGIVKQSGGYIWVYSEPKMGTTFKIYFPCIDSPATFTVRSEGAQIELGRGETILVVEDDAKVLEVAHRFLEEGGYHVISTSDIAKALEIVRDREDAIHLLATDVVMPGMSGCELAERLRSSRPEMKTLYVSGYTDDAIAHHGVLEEDVALLEKPYSRGSLLRAVRRALDGD
jgi:PAS domain S-box-containing protein